jgi:hypothetical protein
MINNYNYPLTCNLIIAVASFSFNFGHAGFQGVDFFIIQLVLDPRRLRREGIPRII